MSASKAQAYQFIEYIKAFVLEVCGIELTGDPIVINGPVKQATVYYLGTNALTAQGRHGDVIMDEFFGFVIFTVQKVPARWHRRKCIKKFICLRHPVFCMKPINSGQVRIAVESYRLKLMSVKLHSKCQ